MEGFLEKMLMDQLRDRKQRLEAAMSDTSNPEHLNLLLKDIDAALEKFARGIYGICEACNDPIEPERLIVDPLVRNCLAHLSAEEQRLLERDLDLAFQIQSALLPKPGLTLPGWESAYRYEPAGPVSGDYCDLIADTTGNNFMFMVGDVSGKGIAASILMSQLHGTLRTLSGTGLSIGEMVERTNRIFCEGSLATHFATLICGTANNNGVVEYCNAGHCRPFVIRRTEVDVLAGSGIPLGVVCSAQYGSTTALLNHGETLLLYTDGLSEATNNVGEFYREDRIADLLASHRDSSTAELISACLKDLSSFRGTAMRKDDLTIMALRRL